MANEMLSHLLPGPRPLPDIGASKTGPDTYTFCLWAPNARQVELEIVAEGRRPAGDASWDAMWPRADLVAMESAGDGYWQVQAEGLAHGGVTTENVKRAPRRARTSLWEGYSGLSC